MGVTVRRAAGPAQCLGGRGRRLDRLGDVGVGQRQVAVPALTFLGENAGRDEQVQVLGGRRAGDTGVARQLDRGPGAPVELGHAHSS
jgi:hypothetical protein